MNKMPKKNFAISYSIIFIDGGKTMRLLSKLIKTDMFFFISYKIRLLALRLVHAVQAEPLPFNTKKKGKKIAETKAPLTCCLRFIVIDSLLDRNFIVNKK